MDLDAKLVSRANGIAAFFRAYPAAEAAAGVRDHIEAFWTPAMRLRLRAQAEAEAPGMDALVLRALLAPSQGGKAPGRPETAGPDEAGAIGASDAG